MKAKTWQDTVMNFMRIEEIDAKNATSNFTDALVDVAREQAEISFKAGMKEVVEWVKQFGGLCNKIEGEDLEYGHHIQYWACREDLSPEKYRELKTVYRFVIEMSYDDWQAKLKSWEVKDGS